MRAVSSAATAFRPLTLCLSHPRLPISATLQRRTAPALQPCFASRMFTSSPVVSRPQQSSYSSGSGSGSKSQAEPTIFSEKASPREVHERPEVQRGMPPAQAHRLSKVDGRNVNNDVGGGSRVRAQMREKGTEEAFRGPSRPRLIYERPGDRELPRIGNKLAVVLALGVLGLGWGLFLLHATNQERLSSSVLRQVTFQLRNSKEVIAVLGEHIKLQENWWALGQPWISGTINLMQGRVDLSFRIKGDKGSGTVYFTSIRPQEKGAWRIVRYKIIADDGEVVRLEDQEVIKAKH